jgi:hypothetical protein
MQTTVESILDLSPHTNMITIYFYSFVQHLRCLGSYTAPRGTSAVPVLLLAPCRGSTCHSMMVRSCFPIEIMYLQGGTQFGHTLTVGTALINYTYVPSQLKRTLPTSFTCAFTLVNSACRAI